METIWGYDPKGPTEQRDVVGSKDGWSEYTLDDGATIRVKAVILDVKRAIDQFNTDGDPIYIMQTAMVTRTIAPAELKRPPAKEK
jgi:hypothetical protein